MAGSEKHIETNIPKVYDPQSFEKKWYAFWEEEKLFHAQADARRRRRTAWLSRRRMSPGSFTWGMRLTTRFKTS